MRSSYITYLISLFFSAFRIVACLFCKSATAYNPFIYFFMGKEFRRDCHNVLGRCWSNICPKKPNQVSGDEIYVGESSRMDRSAEFRKGKLFLTLSLAC